MWVVGSGKELGKMKERRNRGGGWEGEGVGELV